MCRALAQDLTLALEPSTPNALKITNIINININIAMNIYIITIIISILLLLLLIIIFTPILILTLILVLLLLLVIIIVFIVATMNILIIHLGFWTQQLLNAKTRSHRGRAPLDAPWQP